MISVFTCTGKWNNGSSLYKVPSYTLIPRDSTFRLCLSQEIKRLWQDRTLGADSISVNYWNCVVEKTGFEKLSTQVEARREKSKSSPWGFVCQFFFLTIITTKLDVFLRSGEYLIKLINPQSPVCCKIIQALLSARQSYRDAYKIFLCIFDLQFCF